MGWGRDIKDNILDMMESGSFAVKAALITITVHILLTYADPHLSVGFVVTLVALLIDYRCQFNHYQHIPNMR
jgi:hypothetical protein